MARSPRGVFPNGSLQGYLDTRRANLARTSSFWIHGGDILPLRDVISVKGLLGNTWRRFIAMVRHCGMHCAPFDSRLARRCSAERRRPLGIAGLLSSVGAAHRKSRACWAASAPSVRGRDVGRQRRCPPERRQGAIQQERALRFEWMGWLRAFIAGVVLALGLARVSPSGKARASQARMRGFESRHPLQKII